MIMNRLSAMPSGKHQRGCLECDVICNDPFKHKGNGHFVGRPHVSCGFCRFRRMYYGKMPGRIEIYPYTIYVRVHRRFKRIKNLIMHPVAILHEWCAN